ncbi:DNA-3-methyladenine glycosylase I [Paraferrimonas sp. SM1919]|uniref:DNA-3-methyladenine glycosylase I n=1 Tax=Paraferrimonas sp. SM1919 TaxID=2662263 RepID=UPI0013D7F14C|nr:DNA-3-methyladenine glycosylase I [Paraferrimonas sp. SM1919]
MQETRCAWSTSDPIYVDYHDRVWGRPTHDNLELFAKLCLDGQQAGLSWITILKKQDNYYRLFADFVPRDIAKFTQDDVERLLLDKGIIRNRLKVNAIITNAKAYLELEKQGIDFSEFLWSFVGGKTINNGFTEASQVPAETEESKAMSKALKKAGFKFVGPTICYAFMQAVGMVNDHLVSCKCYELCKGE